ncbi:MAG: flavodoxin family protein [Candidatus Thorarchaeota archaeon]
MEDSFHCNLAILATRDDSFVKSVVVYDTRFGNTEEVAKGIAKVLMADINKASEATISGLKGYDALVFSSPRGSAFSSETVLHDLVIMIGFSIAVIIVRIGIFAQFGREK